MSAPFQGGCRCGAVRYECTSEPLFAGHCHCRDCQYASGGPFATVVLVSAPSLRLLRGEVRSFDVVAESGSTVSRKFCPTCGTPLFSALAGPAPLVAIKAGSLDDPSWVKPAAEIWTASAQPWAPHGEGLPRIPKNPGPA